ncbi:MAG TPA: class II aldolase/adducin family protein [Candidatus Limnocylindrales bacterium]|jgi:ribulose-5-phosphate 4-epimerase/fuculose-1-phosphate aldolase
MTDPESVRRAIVDAARRLRSSGLVTGTSGNVSARDPSASSILVTPSGVDYDQMTAAEVVAVGLDGRVAPGSPVPSVDTPNHLAIYRARADVGAVVHTHSPYATAFAIVRRSIPAVHLEAAGYLGGPVRVGEIRLSGPDVPDRMAAALAGGRAILLPNHGVVAVGETLPAALHAAQSVEDAARFAWLASCLGEPVPLDDAEIERLHAFIHRHYGQRPSP